jgi:hypothetical protein
VCAALSGELRELPGRARLAANLASGVRGKELHTSLVPDKEVVVPVTVGLPGPACGRHAFVHKSGQEKHENYPKHFSGISG